ncbi:MAG: cbb3-type cytochrome oxidase assembly protein CcoS [Candidatus Sericytochromatia bacterium]
MQVLIVFVPMAIGVSLGFLVAFLMAAKSGQFEDLETPSHRILYED